MSVINEIWLAIRNDVADGGADPSPPAPPAGSPGNPYAANTPESFGNIMRVNVGNNRLVRLGPGIFQTRGGGGPGVAGVALSKLWSAFTGQRIVGAGMFAMTLRFVWDTTNVAPTGNPGQSHTMILGSASPGSDFQSSFELSDLTLDCALDKTPLYPDPKTIED